MDGRDGVVSAKALRGAGVSARQVETAVADGRLERVRRGWYAHPGATSEVVAAVRAGGRLSCVSALRHHGVWTVDDPQLHIRVSRGVALARTSRLRVHWTDDRRSENPVDPVEVALAVALGCLDRTAAVVALDSVIQLHLVSSATVEALCLKSARGRAALRHIDGRAESGIETIARLRLRSRRIRVRPQAWIPQVGRVDLLIGERLIFELDGRAWHDRPGDFERDRHRDRAAAALGYVMFRASFRQVMTEWEVVEQQILAVVRRRRHMWPGSR